MKSATCAVKPGDAVSMFLCARCDAMRDSDDGCEEFGRLLVCEECADEIREESERAYDGEPINA